MNEAIRAKCKIPPGTKFLRAGDDFTEKELAQISNGFPESIFGKRSTSGADKLTIETDLLECVQGVIASDYARIKSESTREESTLAGI